MGCFGRFGFFEGFGFELLFCFVLFSLRGFLCVGVNNLLSFRVM